jgi:fatty acid kinase fatty acid binding subunit
MKAPTRIAIVTDSTADIPQDLVEENHIHVVPNIIVIDGESLEDGAGISRQDFYTRLPEMKTSPSTATASSGAYQVLYEHLLQQDYENILSIHTSSLLSGIFNSASVAAQSFGERVQVIDSGYVTMGLGFQVLAAAEAARRGLGLLAIQNCMADVRKRVRVIAMLDTLEYLRRSGRVSWAKARLGNLLHLKAFVEVKYGRVLSLGEARTRRKGIERLKEFLKNLGPVERLAILHTNAETDARQILKDTAPNLAFRPLVVNITTIIGTHVGPNGLGFATVVHEPT